ncbi:MAG: Aspartyl-tRNA(Asn) amidotransferase subunit A @ Glutamyl-tRNA(Gln) amidotransferase subunit A, partial [uncultured Actinomycetospora sp.]
WPSSLRGVSPTPGTPRRAPMPGAGSRRSTRRSGPGSRSCPTNPRRPAAVRWPGCRWASRTSSTSRASPPCAAPGRAPAPHRRRRTPRSWGCCARRARWCSARPSPPSSPTSTPAPPATRTTSSGRRAARPAARRPPSPRARCRWRSGRRPPARWCARRRTAASRGSPWPGAPCPWTGSRRSRPGS